MFAPIVHKGRFGKNALKKQSVREGKAEELVEAGRIELPSEETNDREHSCFSSFIFVS